MRRYNRDARGTGCRCTAQNECQMPSCQCKVCQTYLAKVAFLLRIAKSKIAKMRNLLVESRPCRNFARLSMPLIVSRKCLILELLIAGR